MASSSSSSPAPPPSSSPPIAIYPEKAWFYLIVFFVSIGLFNWGAVLYSKIARRRLRRRGIDVESVNAPSRGPVNGGRSLTRFPLAVINVLRVVAFRWTIEFGSYDLRTVDILVILGYIAFLLTWTFVGGLNLAVTQFNAIVWSNRAGILAASQFPLVTILGTKHNAVSLVTGIGYEKLNFFHRVAARSCLGLLLIHVGGKIYAAQGFWPILLQMTWLRLGITALTSLVILFIISLRPIRTRFYEVFFYSHFLLILVFMLGAYFHTRHSGTSYWIWPCFMFWGIDRLMRFSRVVAFNHLYFGFSRRAKLQDAHTELLGDDFVRVRVRRPRHFNWFAGQSAYLIMPSVSSFPLEAHPFSISTVSSDLFQGAGGNRESLRNAEDEDWKELVFLINVRGGFTKRLKEAAVQHQTVKLLIDGPYGCAPDVGAYDTSILIAGGSGVTHTLPVLLGAIEEARKGSSYCRRLVLIWAVRDASHISWISEALFRANAVTPDWLTVSIRIFVTSSKSSVAVTLPTLSAIKESNSLESDGSETKQEREQSTSREQDPEQDWMVPPSVRVEKGRPDFMSILRGEVNTATGNLSVTVCGSQGLTRSVRRALRFPVSGPSSVLSGGPSVTLHVESFGYA